MNSWQALMRRTWVRIAHGLTHRAGAVLAACILLSVVLAFGATKLTFATGQEGPYGGGSITYNPTFSVPFSFTERNSFHFDRKISAEYVLLKPLNNWGADAGVAGGDRVGIGEVAFQTGAAIVPAASDFGITAFTRNAQGQPHLTFGSQTGATFKVQRSVDLSTWTQVGADIPGTAGSADFTDSTAAPAGATAVFYRIVRTIP